MLDGDSRVVSGQWLVVSRVRWAAEAGWQRSHSPARFRWCRNDGGPGCTARSLRRRCGEEEGVGPGPLAGLADDLDAGVLLFAVKRELGAGQQTAGGDALR